MKDRILNGLMLAIVSLALFFSFFQGRDRAAPASVLPLLATACPSPTLGPLDQFRERRACQRKETLAALQSISENEEMEASLRRMAAEEMLLITKNEEMALALEAALLGRGVEGTCVVEKGKVTIFISRSLSEKEAALLFSLAREITGADMENIRIADC